jgi:hypothetical protein
LGERTRVTNNAFFHAAGGEYRYGYYEDGQVKRGFHYDPGLWLTIKMAAKDDGERLYIE